MQRPSILMFKGGAKWLSGRGDPSSQLSWGRAPSFLDGKSEVRWIQPRGNCWNIFGSGVAIITSSVFCAADIWEHCQNTSNTFVLLSKVYFLKQKIPCLLWVDTTPEWWVLSLQRGLCLSLTFVPYFCSLLQWFIWMGFLRLTVFLWHETGSSEQGNIVIIICSLGFVLPGWN